MHSTRTRPVPHFKIGSPSGRTFLSLRFSRRSIWNFLLAICLLVILALGSLWGAQKLWAKPQGSIGTTFELAPGPWGEITAQPILLEAPTSLLSVNFRLGDGRWYFQARTPDEVGTFLRGAGLNAEQVAQILPSLRTLPEREDLLAATPPEALVRSLSPEVRSMLYDKLALVPENFAQVEPFRTTELHLGAYLDPDKLSPELIAEVRSLMWRRGSGLFFSDYNMVADKIASPVEKLELLKQLTHKSSVVLTLRVPPNNEVEGVIDYYRVDGRIDKVEPLLRALSESGGGTLGLANMLPSFARVRLYRYPEALPGKDLSPDCHWATFNFFARGLPDDTLNDAATVSRVLSENYQAVQGQPQFGDVVLLTLPDGSSIHSATYIADNIVFTKNGPSMAAPFIFSTVEDMLAFYPSSESLRLTYYRLKDA
jgi:hypothetical protein